MVKENHINVAPDALPVSAIVMTVLMTVAGYERSWLGFKALHAIECILVKIPVGGCKEYGCSRITHTPRFFMPRALFILT